MKTLIIFPLAIGAFLAIPSPVRAAVLGLEDSVYHGIPNEGGNGYNTQDAGDISSAHTGIKSDTPYDTFLNTALTFSYSDPNGSEATGTFLASDAAGTSEASDTTGIGHTAADANGFINILTGGDYTFSINGSPDDAAAIYLDGSLVTEANTAGAISNVGALDLSGGSYSLEIFYYNTGGGAALGGITVNGAAIAEDASNSGYTLTTTAATPEPSTFALVLGGLGLLAFIARLRRPSRA